MMSQDLIAPRRLATPAGAFRRDTGLQAWSGRARRRSLMASAAILSLLGGGCVNIAAPSEPIVIELNINIRQEVIYRLAEDAANTIEENAEIF